jgi:hypothetical protein
MTSKKCGIVRLLTICFLVSAAWLSGINSTAAQIPKYKAIAITYAVQNPKGHDPNLFPYPKYVDIYSPPYFIQVLGTLANNAGHVLTEPKSDFTFFCQPNSTGISFVPSYISHGSCNCHSSVPTGRKDVMLGLPVEEYKLGVAYDTLRYWSTMTYGINDQKQKGVKGIILKFEHFTREYEYTIAAVDIDTIKLNSQYYDPALSFAPITFDTWEDAFDYCRYDDSAFDMRNDTVEEEEVFFYVPQVDISRYPGYRKPTTFPANQVMDPVKGVSLNIDTITWNDLSSARMAVLVIDYEMVDPIPTHILEWLTETAEKYPHIKIAIVSRSPKKHILKTIRLYEALWDIPHFVIDNNYYTKFNGREPLSYVMINSDQTISFMKSGYDVHSKKDLNSALQKLR